jgi:CBS domain containing-hemolysin-like protein
VRSSTKERLAGSSSGTTTISTVAAEAERLAIGSAARCFHVRTEIRGGAGLAATQLGITLSSLGLGWIGEPALAHLIEPLQSALPGVWAQTGAHAIAIAIAFAIITTLHIVLGELAPKTSRFNEAKRPLSGSSDRWRSFI